MNPIGAIELTRPSIASRALRAAAQAEPLISHADSIIAPLAMPKHLEDQIPLALKLVKHESDAAKSVALLQRDSAALSRMEDIFRTGVIDDSRQLVLGDHGTNGVLKRVIVRNTAGTEAYEAIIKPPNAQVAQEEFAYRFGKRLGIDVPVAVRRPEHGILIEFMKGQQADQASVASAQAIEGLLHKRVIDATRGMQNIDTATSARVERELRQVLDYLTANYDRQPANVLVNTDTGRVAWIDNGAVGLGTGLRSKNPRLKDAFQVPKGSPARVDLHPLTVQIIKERITPEFIRSIHSDYLKTTVDGNVDTLQKVWLKGLGMGWLPHQMEKRLEHVVKHGYYTYNRAPVLNAVGSNIGPKVVDAFRATTR